MKCCQSILFFVLLCGCDTDVANTGALNQVHLTSIHITLEQKSAKGRAAVTLPYGQHIAFNAVGHYSDNTSADITDLVVWSSNDRHILAMSRNTATAKKAGISSVSASLHDITSNMIGVRATKAVIVKIQVSPVTIKLTKGQVRTLTALAMYSDSTLVDISASAKWRSENVEISDINHLGLMSGIDVGSTTFTASKDGVISNRATVVVKEVKSSHT